jgi:CDP-diacylglycerol--serine O-phosphatidyltransferase
MSMKLTQPVDTNRQRVRRRARVLKTIAVLPSLATLSNLVCGLGAVYMCLLSVGAQGTDLLRATLDNPNIEKFFPTFLAIAAYLIVVAMFFDGIDGRLARLARRTSEFGAQLDSMADIVSFGLAPAVIVLCIAHPENVTELSAGHRLYWRIEWVMAAIYVCCAAMRLARFNVENVEDESAHMGFRGLPTPGAAAAIVGMVIFHQDLLGSLAPAWASDVVAMLMPPFAMILGLFMVSRFRYAHMVNTVLRGRRPFRQVVGILVLALVGLLVQPQATIALAGALYAFSGPFGAMMRRLRSETVHVASPVQLAPSHDGEAPPIRPAV